VSSGIEREWHQVSAEGVAPPGTIAVRVCLGACYNVVNGVEDGGFNDGASMHDWDNVSLVGE
jgi:hypothetical protein